jgi:hypothetical protein
MKVPVMGWPFLAIGHALMQRLADALDDAAMRLPATSSGFTITRSR